MFAKIIQAKTSNPRILGLLVFVAGLFYLISASAFENDSSNQNQRLDVKTHRILISGFAFKPKTLKVKVGDKVVWVNKDFAPHNISKSNKENKIDSTNRQLTLSPNLMEKEKFELTIREGFDYYCGLHPSMTGRIVIANRN
ncbi:MAG: hypothetical protein COB38_02055 [Gammaproteobacteria bacterium]|nr:MAG: hypothetical protein COB38_02055 [Gammaproteobacteria bacterium]